MAKRKWLFVLLICLVAAGGLGYYARRRAVTAARAGSALPAMRTATVQRRTLSSTVDTAGQLQPTRQEAVYNKTAAKVTEILVQPGQVVRTGQVLMRLSSEEAVLAVADAADNLEVARARLAAAKESFANAPAAAETQWLKAHQDLLNARAKVETIEAGPKPEELEQARASVRQAEANLRVAEADEVAQKALYNAGAIGRVEYEGAANKLSSARDALTSAKLRLESLLAGADQKEKDAARAALAQAEINSRLAEEAKAKATSREAVTQAEAEVRRAEKALRTAEDNKAALVLSAPFQGMVLAVNAVVGKELPAGSADKPLITLAASSQWQVEAWADESDVARLEAGQRVEVTLSAMEERAFLGRLTAVGGEARVSQNVVSYPIYVTLNSYDPLFRPGMTADAVVQVVYKPDVLAVPDAAVVERRGRTMVQVAAGEQDGEPVYERVEVGLSAGGYTEILSGLEEGQTVLLPTRQGTESTRQASGRNNVPGMPGMRVFMGR